MKTFGEYTEDDFKRLTPAGLLWRVLGVVVVLCLVVGAVVFVGQWISAGKDVISPQNVKAQWQFAYDYDASLDQVAVQWCSIKAAEDAETDPAVKVQRTDQRLAIELNYSRIAAEYNGRLRDAFRARLVRPRDVPAQAPTLQENVAQNC